MRISVSHRTTYRYETTAKSAIQILHLTPRSHDGHFVKWWNVSVDQDCRLSEFEDSLGNIAHSFTVEGPLDTLSILVEGEVETSDTNGIVAGAVERMPPEFYLRQTDLTWADSRIRAFAERIHAKQAEDGTLAALHALMRAVHRRLGFDKEPTTVETPAAEAFAHKQGVCQDFAHVFISAARHLSIPARYVGGYLMQEALEQLDAADVQPQEAGHAWAEAYIPDLGWVSFDPTHSISATEAYVRVAIGLDYLGAAPVRGTRYGGGGESMDVAVHVAAAQIQNQ
ncbi:MAG TPA: transglutaminase family protein, partial [Hyphomicrobiales bacterium]|nr:transglutaminase family protein [Hyphomicrobiales bacterium]